jgi:aryl-alcohol dehydrogenase-like predicted oxidoreductase
MTDSRSTTLTTRPLGRTGLELTTVGFGAWAIGGADWAFGWGPQDDDASVAAIRHAVDRGVGWIDTAAAYGLGHSEEVVGRAVRDVPAADRPLIFTKCGLVWEEGEREPRRSGDPARIKRDCDASLRRLGVEVIDLFQIHWPPDDGTPVEEAWQALVDLRDEGKIRAAGVSNFDVAQLEACERIGHVDSLQPPFSLIHRDAASELLPWCEEHGTGVVVYSPMQSGLLTGRMTRERAASLGDDDWRAGDEEFNEPNLSRNLELQDALRPVAERHGVSPAAVAVAWTLTWPGVTGAIVGARSPEQVDGWIDAGSLQLTTEDVGELTEALRRTGAGHGPTHPA